MTNALHVTSGDEAALRIRQSGVTGVVLPWRDVLHEGPAPAGLSLDEMSRVRARFLSGCLWGEPFEQLLVRFRERDLTLKDFKRYDQVVLWFDHDLYDQLQLLQVMHWFTLRDVGSARLSLICIEQFPGMKDFRGLGQLDGEQMRALYPQRVLVETATLDVARRGWEAFTSDRPVALQELVNEGGAAGLPFLRPALERLLEQYPSTREGLARSERQILQAVKEGKSELAEVYRTSQIEREERPFMADWPFLLHAEALCAGPRPLLEFEDGQGLSRDQGPPYNEAFWSRRLRQTEAGVKVLSGGADRTRFQEIDRWIGGVHLHGETLSWRWGHGTQTIVAQ